MQAFSRTGHRGRKRTSEDCHQPDRCRCQRLGSLRRPGVCARQRGDLAQAETWLRKALDSDPNNTVALYALAEISQGQGKTLQGRAFLQRYHAQTRPTPQSLWLGILIETAQDGDAHLRQQYSALLSGQFPNSEEARRLNKP